MASIKAAKSYAAEFLATAGVTPTPKLGWCEHCGEGITDFCRGKTDLCPKGLMQPGARGVQPSAETEPKGGA